MTFVQQISNLSCFIQLEKDFTDLDLGSKL